MLQKKTPLDMKISVKVIDHERKKMMLFHIEIWLSMSIGYFVMKKYAQMKLKRKKLNITNKGNIEGNCEIKNIEAFEGVSLFERFIQ